MRLFVAVWPSPEVVERLERLDRPPRRDIRWVVPDEWHVTLAFLGEVPSDRLTEVSAALSALISDASDASDASAAVTAVEAELGPRTARLGRGTLCAPVRGLDRLAEQVQHALVRRGFPLEQRPFRGHLTLARGRGRRPVPTELAGSPIEACWVVRELALVRSQVGAPRGGPTEGGSSRADAASPPRYQTVERWPLADGGGR